LHPSRELCSLALRAGIIGRENESHG